MIFVGCFNEEQIRNKEDMKVVEKTKEETGLQYVKTDYVKKKNKIIGLKIWVCDRNEAFS